MIVLDTNVVSEPLRSAPDPAVAAWLDAQAIETLYLTSITLAELRFGVACLPSGRRRDRLRDRIDSEVVAAFEGRILPFDEAASAAYATLRAEARARGEAIAATDGYIAGIVAAHGFAIATRDRAPFQAAGLVVIDPFEP
ncbi:MAG: type II toxin-antitoxin system VapC family toxin [Micropruina sp.]|uniref:type II toxin-antitoxin system VapC family toxin n=1 Tax=Micropruina sp. TaxID=2737536 RepID=UPI0039E3E6DC